MIHHHETMSINDLVTDIRKGRIQPAEIQRSVCWEDKRCSGLIDSILRGYCLPEFFFSAKPLNGGKYIGILDGLQRSTAIRRFCDGEIKLPKKAEPITIDGNVYEIAGCRYDNLPDEVQDHFDRFSIPCTYITEATKKELSDQFIRLQQGVAMKPQEIRHALVDTELPKVLDSITAEVDELMPKERCKKNYYFIEKMLCIYSGCYDVSNLSLVKLYSNFKDIERDDEYIVNFVKEVKQFASFVKDAGLHYGDATTHYIYGFYTQMRKNKMLSNGKAFYAAIAAKVAPNLLNNTWTLNNWDASTGGKGHGSAKASAMNSFIAFIREQVGDAALALTEHDSSRSFDAATKSLKYEQQQHKCLDCGCEFPLSALAAHHIKPWAEGGKTEIDNCALLCDICHSKRHNCN